MATKSKRDGDDAAALVEDGACSLREAVRLSGVGRSVLYEMMRTGDLPYVKLGARRLIPRRALRDLLAEHLVGAAAR